MGSQLKTYYSQDVDFTNRQRATATQNDLIDTANRGANYGVYQRLFSRNDVLVLGDYQ